MIYASIVPLAAYRSEQMGSTVLTNFKHPFQKDFRHLVENMQSASAKDKHLEATMKSTAI